MIEFSVYCKDVRTADIIIYDDNSVDYFKYSDDLMSIPFNYTPQKQDVIDFIESRCIKKERALNTPGFLEALGLSEYDPWKIVRKTHGVMWEDFLWVRFPGDTVKWEDIKIRG